MISSTKHDDGHICPDDLNGYGARLRALFRLRGMSEHEAEDATQGLFLKFLEGTFTTVKSICGVRHGWSYMKKCGERFCIDVHRKKTRRLTTDQVLESVVVDDRMSVSEEELLNECVEEVRKKMGNDFALIARYLGQELTRREIEELLGITPDALEYRIRKLRRVMNGVD